MLNKLTSTLSQNVRLLLLISFVMFEELTLICYSNMMKRFAQGVLRKHTHLFTSRVHFITIYGWKWQRGAEVKKADKHNTQRKEKTSGQHTMHGNMNEAIITAEHNQFAATLLNVETRTKLNYFNKFKDKKNNNNNF